MSIFQYKPDINDRMKLFTRIQMLNIFDEGGNIKSYQWARIGLEVKGIQFGLAAHGKGKGIKAHDGMMAWLCYSCHFNYDQGTGMNKQEKRDFILTAICKTYMKMWDEEVIEYKG